MFSRTYHEGSVELNDIYMMTLYEEDMGDIVTWVLREVQRNDRRLHL